MKILVVEDSAVMRKIVIKHLVEAGETDITEAGNGKDALDKMAGVELILLDWNMPVMDGITFVKEVRKNSSYDNVPIVMVTTEGGQKEVLEAMKAGVNDYIVKPFTSAILHGKLKTFLDN